MIPVFVPSYKRAGLFLRACNNDKLVKVYTTHSGVPSIKFNWKGI